MTPYTLRHNNLEAHLGSRFGVGMGDVCFLDVTKSESPLHQESPTDSMRQGTTYSTNNNNKDNNNDDDDDNGNNKSAFQLMMS